MIRVLVVDDHDVVRSGLTALLPTELGIEVAGRAADGPVALAEAERLRPDLVLLDIALPELDGMAVAARSARALPSCRTLMLTALDRPGRLRRALAAGAGGYVLKSTAPAGIADAVRRTAAGGRVIDPRVRGEGAVPSEPAHRQGGGRSPVHGCQWM